MTTTVNEPAERLRAIRQAVEAAPRVTLAGDSQAADRDRLNVRRDTMLWLLDAAERAIGAEVLVGCYHGQPHRCSRCGFEWPAARLTRERNGQ